MRIKNDRKEMALKPVLPALKGRFDARKGETAADASVDRIIARQSERETRILIRLVHETTPVMDKALREYKAATGDNDPAAEYPACADKGEQPLFVKRLLHSDAIVKNKCRSAEERIIKLRARARRVLRSYISSVRRAKPGFRRRVGATSGGANKDFLFERNFSAYHAIKAEFDKLVAAYRDNAAECTIKS